MKKLISCLLSVLLLVGAVLPMPAAAADFQAGVVSTAWGSLNVRSGPLASNSVVSTLAKGSYVTLTAQSGGWWRVEYAKGKYGWCHGDFITPVSSHAAAVKTAWGNLNVRSGPGTGYSRLDALSSGTGVQVLSTSGSWSRILYSGTKTGWVSSSYLSTAAYPALSLAVPSYKQTDSRWAHVTLGSSGKTIGQIGCATTAIAMMESYRTGKTVYPDAMSKRLSYSASGNVYWPSDYTVITASGGYLQTLYRLLSQGKPVLFGAKNNAGGQHWVVVNGYTGGSSLSASGFTVLDPGSNSRTTLQQFLTAYPNFYKFFHY